jgi:hypothetical protein
VTTSARGQKRPTSERPACLLSKAGDLPFQQPTKYQLVTIGEVRFGSDSDYRPHRRRGRFGSESGHSMARSPWRKASRIIVAPRCPWRLPLAASWVVRLTSRKGTGGVSESITMQPDYVVIVQADQASAFGSIGACCVLGLLSVGRLHHRAQRRADTRGAFGFGLKRKRTLPYGVDAARSGA